MEQKRHPMYIEIESFGPVEQASTEAIFHVYLDLVEVRNWWNVTPAVSKSSKLVYLRGSPKKNDTPKTVIPFKVNGSSFSCMVFEELFSELSHECQLESFYMAFVDSDFTTVYYQITNGLLPPESPEQLESKKNTQRKRFLDRRSKFAEVPHGTVPSMAEEANVMSSEQSQPRLPPPIPEASVNATEEGEWKEDASFWQ